ncbi:MAG: sigma-54 interaction domain-containing protein [Chitinophagales bacterium]
MNIQSIKQRYGIIGNSSGLNNALSTALQIAPTDLSALILGESGVGKEVFSRIIHHASPRKHNEFIAVNCGAIPAGTIYSELFGHEKGAYTGASTSEKRKGYFEVVDGGTIFLDEIGEMPMETQQYLLRVLESGEFIRMGGSKTLKTDVRVVAATNIGLWEAVRRGKFREDLYYRLSTVPIKIPPLRERKEDIYLLFRKFTTDFAERNRTLPISLDEQAKEILVNYTWPGNIRELKNIAEQISVLASNRRLNAEELLHFLPSANSTRTRFPVLATQGQGFNNNGNSFSEREILYKMLFDMKKDLNDLKQIILQMLQQGNFTPEMMPDNALFREIQMQPSVPASTLSSYNPATVNRNNAASSIVLRSTNDGQYVPDNNYNSAEVVEESLRIEDKEKELIQKALKKHRGKRKDAAEDLGISERTLYRKIKDYAIKE